ncbi:MAG: AbrB/MazE/SpoVT family DNA-binding domain-containing protein [Candidatus Fermentibacter sp.]|nr:AbrB/MazE/SpoVT family DNA-binding domain-containing protein [Candidatus Fermentibacter sp.]
MKARIIRIGNSRGLRLPKPLIEQAGISDEVDLQIREGSITISRVEAPRAGWADASAALYRNGGDDLLLDQHQTRFDESEWEW